MFVLRRCFGPSSPPIVVCLSDPMIPSIVPAGNFTSFISWGILDWSALERAETLPEVDGVRQCKSSASYLDQHP